MGPWGIQNQDKAIPLTAYFFFHVHTKSSKQYIPKRSKQVFPKKKEKNLIDHRKIFAQRSARNGNA